MNIGKNIKYLRQRNNVTQETLADHLEITYQAVSKWETEANTPDISLLPRIAKYFNVSLDTLFSENISTVAEVFEEIKDDDVIRVIQLQGKRILKIDELKSGKSLPIELIFPHNCNDTTQYFKVEVFGVVITDGSINGDVICHQTIHCGTINGDVVCQAVHCGTINGCNVKSEANIIAHEINCSGKVVCNNIVDCYKLIAKTIDCSGEISCQQISGDIDIKNC